MEIKDFICIDESSAALKFLKKLASSPKPLTTFPNLGSPVPELRDLGDYRQLVVGPYRLIYTATSEHIHVLRILHHAQDFWKACGLS